MTEPTYHDGETFADAKRRWVFGVLHPFTRNPLARDRMGWEDFLAGHSTTNLYVTYARESPRDAGHVWRYSVLALLAVIAAMVAAFVWVRYGP